MEQREYRTHAIPATAPQQRHHLSGIEIALLVAAAGIILISFLQVVVFLGRPIPQENLVGDYLFAVAWAALIGLSISIWPVAPHYKPILRDLWIARCVMTLVLMLMAEFYFDQRTDFYRYFVAGRADEWLGWELVGGDKLSGTNAISAMVWMLRRVLPDSYHAIKVTFSLFGLVAIFFFYRAAAIFLQRDNIRYFYVLGLFPSLLFWSSILGKEPVTLLGVGLYTYSVVAWYRYRQFRFLLVLMAGIALTTAIRPWMAFIMGAPLGLLVLGRAIRGLHYRILFVAFVGFVLFFAWNQFKAGLGIETFSDVLNQANRIAYNAQAVDLSAGSTQFIDVEFESMRDIALFVPFAAFTALFRPLPGELFNPFGLLASIENAWLLLLLLRALNPSRWRDMRHPLMLWAILLLVIWSVIYGFVSVYNLGTGMRYRQQIFPILLTVLLYLGHKQKPTTTNAARKPTRSRAPRKPPAATPPEQPPAATPQQHNPPGSP